MFSIQQFPSVFQDFFVVFGLFFKVFLVIKYKFFKNSSILLEKRKNSAEIRRKNFFKHKKIAVRNLIKNLETVNLHKIKPTNSKIITKPRKAPFVKISKNKKVITAEKKLKNISPEKTRRKLLKPIFRLALIISYTKDKNSPNNTANAQAYICVAELISHIYYLKSLEKNPTESLSSAIYTTA